ncbi:DUF2798 domain-containing protein [Pseudorhodoferax sp.]|uniref:DUF2798 domain-containing protein n=1 Tax=Pseudorhodoferax sp. TaxID=1993553 RepID=UPI002DD63245|nr:DUF2798 domain-containing protein [Pseudorhodoferax sp.]
MPSQASSSRPWKLPKRLGPVAFAFYMASIMAFLMSMVIVAANGGADARFLDRVLASYALAMPAAFASVMVVRPVVIRLVGWTVHA